MRQIAIITDFGNSHYVGILKGVISLIDPNIRTIDITHNVSPQNIVEGAFILKEALPFFADNTVYLGIVDPQVGSKRRGIVVKSANRFFVGPDNGLFEFVFREYDFEVFEVVKNDFFTKNVSYTFHGRDIFAPLAALIASGRDLSDIIRRTDNPVRLDIPSPIVSEQVITGEILYIDSFGNIITNISSDLVKNCRCSVKFKNKRLGRIRNTYSDVPRGVPVAVIGSSGMLEIAVNSGSAKKRFNVRDDRRDKNKIYVRIYGQK
ncbi:MAG: SAM-dependent chlorinase/fluorinase [Deltaproteobacteria bacterium]|nr:SAM-dependent chlorinase/fluorinase [Deltaproteobacteria bacterium]